MVAEKTEFTTPEEIYDEVIKHQKYDGEFLIPLWADEAQLDYLAQSLKNFYGITHEVNVGLHAPSEAEKIFFGYLAILIIQVEPLASPGVISPIKPEEVAEGFDPPYKSQLQ